MRGRVVVHPSYAGGDLILVGQPVFVVGVGSGTVRSVGEWNVDVDFGESADTVSPDMLEYMGPRLGDRHVLASEVLAWAFIGLVSLVVLGVGVLLVRSVWGWVL